MVVVCGAAGAVAVRSIREANAIEEAFTEQDINRAIDCRTTQAWVNAQELMPESLGSEVGAGRRKRSQALGDESALPCITQPNPIEDTQYLRCRRC